MPNFAIVVAKHVRGGEIVRSAELEMTASVDGIFRPNGKTRTVWISTTVHAPLRMRERKQYEHVSRPVMVVAWRWLAAMTALSFIAQKLCTF